MAWRTLLITEPTKLSLKLNSVVISTFDVTVSLEDIAIIILDNPQVTITSGLLCACSINNVMLISCDAKHLPNGYYLSSNQHSRQCLVMRTQVKWSKPFKKGMWKNIIKNKILNQNECLNLCTGTYNNMLTTYETRVLSGDTDNREAVCAKIYFPLLWGGSFTRRNADVRNIALNYGYSIIRGVIARTITAHGFITALGIHHDSELNQFNLIDDIIEVFRPIVDRYVFYMNLTGDIFTKDNKVQLLDILNTVVYFNKLQLPLLTAITAYCKNFAGCSANNTIDIGIISLHQEILLYDNDK